MVVIKPSFLVKFAFRVSALPLRCVLNVQTEPVLLISANAIGI